MIDNWTIINVQKDLKNEINDIQENLVKLIRVDVKSKSYFNYTTFTFHPYVSDYAIDKEKTKLAYLIKEKYNYSENNSAYIANEIFKEYIIPNVKQVAKKKAWERREAFQKPNIVDYIIDIFLFIFIIFIFISAIFGFFT